MSKKITDLRDELFDTISKLKAGEIDIDTAKAINSVSQTIVNSAKVEVDFLKTYDGLGTGSGFVPLDTIQVNPLNSKNNTRALSQESKQGDGG